MKSPKVCALHVLFAVLTGVSFIGIPVLCAQETESIPVPEAQIREVTTHILKNANKANCKPGSCKILVVNFALPSGLISQLGVQLADEFSKELASQQNGIEVIDRSVLQAYIAKERISPDLLANDRAVRWLGKELNATTVLSGVTRNQGPSVDVRVKLFSCNKDKAGPVEEFTLSLPGPKNALSGFDPVAKSMSEDRFISTPVPYTAGANGVSQTSCIYCPNPDYTSDARAAKLDGSVLLKVVISPEGRVASAKIIRGAPLGMNEAALEALRYWRLKPATFQGKPVAAMTTIEIVFHMLN